MRASDDSFRKMVEEGYGLTTAQIYYYRPDARSILGEFIWQFHDLHPRFPRLRRFLEFWHTSIDAPINSVVIAHQQLIKPSEIRRVGNEFYLN